MLSEETLHYLDHLWVTKPWRIKNDVVRVAAMPNGEPYGVTEVGANHLQPGGVGDRHRSGL